MAVKIARKRRKNADGSYDIVHYETQAKAVWMSDGRSVDEALSGSGTDYTAFRARSISLQQDEVTTSPANGELVGVYTIS